MADTGWKFPGTMVNNRVISGSDFNWINENNAKADDGSSAASTSGAAPGQQSSGLAASNFDFSVIPAGATIEGIEIRIGDYALDVNVQDESFWSALRLIHADDTDGSQERSGALLKPTLSLQSDNIGGASDLWTEIWTAVDVTDVDFGFFIGWLTGASGEAHTLSVDFMQMRVFYHVGLPTTIDDEAQVKGYYPPFQSSGGNFYALSVRNTVGFGTVLRMLKNTDPTKDSWVTQGSGPSDLAADADYLVLSAVQDGDKIHAVTWLEAIADNEYEYHVFNMATDVWDVTEELIEAPTNDPTFPWCSIAIRSDGDVIVAYAGDTDQVMGGKKERVDFNLRESGTGVWDGPVALDAAGDVHYGNPNCILGTNDGIHFVWQRQTFTTDPPTDWEDTEGRTLDSADSLSTVDSAVAASGAQMLGMQNNTTYDDAGTQRIKTVYSHTNTREVRVVNSIEDGSDNISLVDSSASFLSPTLFDIDQIFIISIAALDDVLHVVFSGGGTNGSDQDVYYTTSTDDGATWDAATEELDAVTCNFISANVYVRGADTVLAYVYDDGGIQKYNEKVLIAGALIEPPLLHSFAVTRAANY